MLTAPIGFALLALGLLVVPPTNPASVRLEWLGRERLGSDPGRPRLRLLTMPRIRRRRRRGAAEGVALTGVVAAIADEYAAGATAAAAFSAAAGAGGAFRQPLLDAARLAEVGEDVSAALTRHSALAGLGVACTVASRAGSPLTSVLTGLRIDLEADTEVRRAVNTALAGPRASATLLALLPVVGLTMGAGMGAHPWQVLTHTAAGVIALFIGVALDLTGLVWVFGLTRRALP
jgi:tight adherence protein B